MPYYNGFFHLKYQNLTKITLQVLCWSNVCNQVAGSTINELRQAEVEQHWWERTAMYRFNQILVPRYLWYYSYRVAGRFSYYRFLIILMLISVKLFKLLALLPESPQGTRTGLGGCRGSGSLCHGHANEHGWILILCSHTIESQYLQVYDKMWDVKDLS